AAVAVLDRHLALAVGAEEGEEPRAPRFAEPLPDAVRGVDGEGHVLPGLVAGVAEHHALVACALLLEEPLALGDALRDVERLPLDRRHDGAAVAVEAALGGVADAADHLLRDLAELDPRLARDLAGDDHEAGLDERLAGDAAVRVFGEQCIEDGVRDLVADLVRVALVDRFRRENVVLQHGWRVYPMLVGRGKRAPRGRRGARQPRRPLASSWGATSSLGGAVAQKMCSRP